MYKIIKTKEYLMVRLDDDFNYYALRTIIRHETLLPEYATKNDIWLIGEFHALVSLGDLEEVTLDFQRMYPPHASRKRTAIVVEPGITEAIVQLWIKQAQGRIPFTCRVFHTLAAAEAWVGSSVQQVA